MRIDASQPAVSQTPPPRPGRVLRVKTGYNPNSSSVGTDIPTFLAAAAGASALATLVLTLLSTAADRIRRDAPEPEPEREDPDGQQGTSA